MKRLVGYFFQGSLYIAPFGVTAYILYKVFVLVDEPVRDLEVLFFGKHVPGIGVAAVVGTYYVQASLPLFQVNGQFSEVRFQEMLGRMFYSEKQFFDDLEQILIQNPKGLMFGNLGMFKIAFRKKRNGFNIKTKQPISIPAKYTVTFKTKASFKNKLNDRLKPSL